MCSDFNVFQKNPLELPKLWKYYEETNFPERKGNFPNKYQVHLLISWIFIFCLNFLSFSLSTHIWEQWRVLSTDSFSYFEQYWVWSSGIKKNRSHRSPAICAGFSVVLKHVEAPDCKLNVWQEMCLASSTPFWLLI